VERPASNEANKKQKTRHNDLLSSVTSHKARPATEHGRGVAADSTYFSVGNLLVILSNLARLTSEEVYALGSASIENEMDIYLLIEDKIGLIFNCESKVNMKVTRLHQLGRFVAKGSHITQSTTMREVDDLH
jgi:hypothetical protein